MNLTTTVENVIQNDGPATRVIPAVSWPSTTHFALFLALVIAALFSGVLFGGETFFYRDYGVFGYPLAKYHRDCFWRGEFPIWNSLNNCGMPHLAQWNTLLLYPLSLIYLLFPLPWSLGFFCMVHLFLGGMGMYLLALFQTKSRFAAAIAGVAFAFNGLTLNCLMWPNNMAGLAWVPLVVLTVQRGWQEGGRLLIVGALAGAIQMLSGAPEIILFTWLILLTLFITDLWLGKTSRLVPLGRAGLIYILVIGLAAAQLFPFLSLLLNSERDSNYGGGGQSWAMPSAGLMNLVLPFFQAYASPQGVYFQPTQGWTSSYYSGVAVLFLALLAFQFAPRRKVWPLWGVAIFGLIMALGKVGLLYAAINKVFPGLGFLRYPVKFVMLATFVLPLLAAMTVAGYERELPEKHGTRNLLWPTIVLGAVVLVIAGGVLYSWWRPFYGEPWTPVLWNALLRVLFLGVVIAVIIRAAPQRDTRVRCALQGIVLLALILDVWTHMPNQNPTINSVVYEPGLLAGRLDQRCFTGESRALLSLQTHELLFRQMVTNRQEDFIGRRAGLLANLNLIDGIGTSDGFYSINVLEQRQIWGRMFFLPLTNFPAGLADFVGVSEITTNLFEWQRRPSAQPLIAAGARPIFVDHTEILDRLCGRHYDPRKIVFLPSESKVGLTITNGCAAQTRMTTVRAGHIAANVESPEAALVTLAETYYDGWQASVDGRPAKIWRANHAFQAIEVPAGRHHVEFVYKEKTLGIATTISASSLLCCVLAWFKPKRSDRKVKSDC